VVSLAGALAGVAIVGLGASARPPPDAPECPIFPPSNHFNLPVTGLPVLPNSDALVRSIGADKPLHPDFGSGRFEGARIGIPYTTVGAGKKKVKVSFEFRRESDRRKYPLPRNAPIEGGPDSDGDRHVLVIERDRCRLYELYRAFPPKRGSKRWKAGSGAIFDLDSNALRPEGHTSADAAGLPIFPGLARFDEVARGEIDHALRFTVPRTRREFIYPARHFASDSNDPNLPAMGQRFRLKPSVDISGFSPQSRIVLAALKRYGMIVADNGSPWFVTGAPSSRWDNADLRELRRIQGSDFEAVDSERLPRPHG
jgi:hypothetical protein